MKSDIPYPQQRSSGRCAMRGRCKPEIWVGLLLCLFAGPRLLAQVAVDPGSITAGAIAELRTAQEIFPGFAGDLETIIERLERSRTGPDATSLFPDSCHVSPLPSGLGAFSEARQAVIQIGLLRKRQDLPPFLGHTLEGIRDQVVDAYQFLAEAALQEARALGEHPSSDRQITNAERQFAEALADRAAEDFPKAMQSLRQAWEHAQLALPTLGGDGNGPRLNIETPGDGDLLFASPVTVAGMVQLLTPGTVGPEDVTVEVNGLAAQVANRSFQAPGVTLREGLNAIVGIARDRDGDTAAACIAVRLDTTPRPRVAVFSGDGQTAPIRTLLPQPLVVRVIDAAGDSVAGVPVVFRVIQGNGSLGGGSRGELTTTDGAGQARASFTLGSRAGVGVNRVRATAVGFAGEVVFSAIATTTAPASINVVGGNNQKGGVGAALAEPLSVLVTDAGQNPVVDAAVTFEVVAGTGTVAGAATAVVETDENGRASVAYSLGPEVGLDNHRVEARFAGLTNEPATFKASGFVLGDPADTRLGGVVLDNQGDPVPGTTLRVRGSAATATADGEGQFVLTAVPVGEVVLEVDASTTTRPGTWAHLEFELHTLPGVDNTLEKPIYILPLNLASGRIAGGAEDVTVTVPEVPGFSLTVLAGSATFPDGSPTGLVSVTPVHADKVPMAPGSGMQPRFIVTVQPAGARFDPPAPVTFPNVDALAPGTVTEMFSFDHDLGQFVSIGTGTVSEDGLVVRSDPGFGIVKAGWHCAAPQSGSGAGASLQVEITTPEPVILCRDENGQAMPTTIAASGGPPRDAEYQWDSSDSSVVSLDPSGGGLCRDQSQCDTMASAGAQGGMAMAKVTITCTTTGATADDEIEVINPGVEVTSVDLCANEVHTRLRPVDPALMCELILSMIAADGGRHEFLREQRTGGDHNDMINFDALPTQVEFVEVEAEWRCGTCAVGPRDREAAHFLSLGHIRHTAYNCPSSGDATCTGGANVDICFTDAGCQYDGPAQVPQNWLTQVTGAAQGTGCGSVPGHGDVQIEEFCLRPTQLTRFPPPPACVGLPTFREGGAIAGRCGGAVNANTVAVDDGYLNGLLPCGTNICIFNGARAGIEKSVADRCPGCGLGRIDNFSDAGTCGIGDFAPDAVTLRLY